MDTVFPALYQMLAADATLAGYVQDVSLGNNPDDPKSLSQPFIAIHPFGSPSIEGLHGAVDDIQMEIKIWGYGNAMYKDALRAAARIDVLLLTRLSLPSGNFIGAFRSITGWQDIKMADAKHLQLQNQYSARYWAAAKISALNN